VLDEPGSATALELWSAATRVHSSQVAYPELRAAVAAAGRAGRFSARRLRAIVRAIDELDAEIDTIAVDEGLARHAGELAQRHALRGFDAIHLAAALSAHSDRLVVVTWDRGLADAANAAGCMVAPAEP
jgi:predicted nucleic acid-binding protein